MELAQRAPVPIPRHFITPMGPAIESTWGLLHFREPSLHTRMNVFWFGRYGFHQPADILSLTVGRLLLFIHHRHNQTISLVVAIAEKSCDSIGAAIPS